jgi:hypothetical protein
LRPLRIEKFKCVDSLSRRAAFLNEEAALPREQINDGLPTAEVRSSPSMLQVKSGVSSVGTPRSTRLKK